MHLKRFAGAIAAITLAAATVTPAVVSAHGRPAHAGSSIPTYKHIFLVMMENHSYDQIIGNPGAPRINALARTYGLATQYYGVTHPSEPNYVATIGGSYFGIQDDAPYSATANGVNHTIDAPSLASQLETAGLSWKTYQQSLPYPGYTGTRYPTTGPTLYASKHNPFLNFASIQHNAAELQKIVPDTQLFADVRSGAVPSFSYIAPDQCHDMHGTAGCQDDATLYRDGDTYVSAVVNAIMSARVWTKGNNAIVVLWDEDDFATTNLGCCDANPGGGHIATIVITNHGARGVRDATPYNHYSLLQTIQAAFHLGCLQHTCDTANVTTMRPLFASGKGHGVSGSEGAGDKGKDKGHKGHKGSNG